MTTNRRGFFGALAGLLAAPFVAKVLPKPIIEPPSVFIDDYFISASSATQQFSVSGPTLFAPLYPEWVAALSDLDFYSGDQWSLRPCKYGRLNKAQRQFNPARLPA